MFFFLGGGSVSCYHLIWSSVFRPAVRVTLGAVISDADDGYETGVTSGARKGSGWEAGRRTPEILGAGFGGHPMVWPGMVPVVTTLLGWLSADAARSNVCSVS